MRPRSEAEIARTRAFWLANRPSETAAPAFTPDPPAGWLVALFLIVGLGIQISYAPFLAIRGATPSLVTLVVAWYALRTGVARGLAFGLFAGACEDALGGATGVAWTFATGLAGAVAGRLAGTSFTDMKVVLVSGVALLTFGRFAVFAFAMALGGRPLALGASVVRVALWQSALDASLALALLVGIPLFEGLRANRR